jgi:arginase
MPLGFLLGQVENASKYPSMQWFQPCVNPKDVCYIGLRDLDNGERKAVKSLGIKAFTVS